MCENITNKYLNYDKINIIKNKLKKNPDNPKIVLENIKIINNRNINIIQDGVLIAGTKQRVAKLFFTALLKNNNNIKTIVYTGQSNGFGPVASAYGAYKLGLNCEIFLAGNIKNINTRQIHTLHALKANINICPTWEEAKKLMWRTVTNNYNLKPGYYIIPMGLNTGNMTDLLSKQIKRASKNIIPENARIWLVAGSGGIAMSILKAFPTAKLFIYLTGHGKHKKSVIDWANSEENVTIIKPMNNKNEKELISNRHLYYSSVADYDDLIWPYVKKYALDGDFIWNIASED